MFAPGLSQVAREFHSTNASLASFTVTIYILGYAVGPLFMGPLSELYGRLPVYHVSNTLFVVFTVACALSTNLGMLIAFRFLDGCVGSTPLVLGGGTITDMITQQKRGGVMAIWAMGPLLGPVIGPVSSSVLFKLGIGVAGGYPSPKISSRPKKGINRYQAIVSPFIVVTFMLLPHSLSSLCTDRTADRRRLPGTESGLEMGVLGHCHRRTLTDFSQTYSFLLLRAT